MQFSVRHSMPGRIRLHVPMLCLKRSLAETFLGWLGTQAGIKTARINYDCASLVLEYDPNQEPLLRALMERFQNASLAEIKLLIATSTTAPTERKRKCRAARRFEEISAGAADAIAADGVQRQSGGRRGQSAVDALERHPDRQARLEGVGHRTQAQHRRARYAGDQRFGAAGQSDGRLHRHLADQARRLDPRPDRRGLPARDQRTARIPVQDRLGAARWRGRSRSRPASCRPATSSWSIPAR